jgi:hypothetical protein
LNSKYCFQRSPAMSLSTTMVSCLVRVKALALEMDLADEMNNGSKFHIIVQLHQPIGSDGAQF